MYVYYNPNPERNHVGDCVIRALTKALDMSWDDAYITLMVHAYKQKDMPSSNSVWGSLLTSYGYNSYMAPVPCDLCMSVREFSNKHVDGTYILATGSHVVTLDNGDYFDSWDSGDETVVYYFTRR